MAELKKCPFCGSGVAKIKVGSPFMWEHAIVCADCGASTKLMCGITPSIARDRAIKAWNNRATEAEIRASVIDEFAEEMKKMCKGVTILIKQIDEIAEQLKEE